MSRIRDQTDPVADFSSFLLSVSFVTRLRAGRSVFDSLQGRILLFATASRPFLGPTQPFFVSSSRGQSGRGLNATSLLNLVLKLRMRGAIPHLPYVCMAWRLIKHRNSFILPSHCLTSQFCVPSPWFVSHCSLRVPSAGRYHHHHHHSFVVSKMKTPQSECFHPVPSSGRSKTIPRGISRNTCFNSWCVNTCCSTNITCRCNVIFLTSDQLLLQLLRCIPYLVRVMCSARLILLDLRT
jgi:hypothetical protein